MSSGLSKSNYESFTVAFVLFSLAIAILAAWVIEDWILMVPIFLIEIGIGFLALGFLIRPGEMGKRPVMRNAYYYVVWGSICALIGSEWLVNRQYPGNVPLLIALFIIWMGVITLGLAIGRNRERAATP